MMYNDVEQRVLKVISEVLNRKESEISLKSSLHGDLAATSLDRMTIFIALEDEFQRTIPPEQVTGLATIREIADFITGKLREPPAT
jgi:acyl carrier protein